MPQISCHTLPNVEILSTPLISSVAMTFAVQNVVGLKSCCQKGRFIVCLMFILQNVIVRIQRLMLGLERYQTRHPISNNIGL